MSRALLVALIVSVVVLIALLLGWSLHLPFAKITDFDRALVVTAVLAAILLIASARARHTAGAWMSSPVGLFTALTLFAAAMSFGPEIQSRVKLIEDQNIYRAFYDHVPGFDGLRVPARFGMIVALGLAALTAYGVAAIQERRRGAVVPFLAGALIVAEAIAVPLPLNGNDTNYKQRGLAPLPPRVETGARAPAVYHYLAQLPASAAIVELPFGEVAFEARYVFYSTVHWRRLVNGYSGGAPVEYGLLAEWLKDIAHEPERAWTALATSGATHAVVHEGSYAEGGGAAVSQWLRAHGAVELASFDADRVFALPAR